MCVIGASRALLYSEPPGHDQDKKGPSPFTVVKHHISEGENTGYRGLLVASRGHFTDNGCVSVASRAVRVRVLVATRDHFSG